MTPRAVLLPIILCTILNSTASGEEPNLTRLAKQRREAAKKTYEVTWANYRDRRASGDMLYRWSRRWLESERQLSRGQADEIAAVKAHFDRMAELERLIDRVARTGTTTIDEITAAEYYRVEAEVWLLQAKEKKER